VGSGLTLDHLGEVRILVPQALGTVFCTEKGGYLCFSDAFRQVRPSSNTRCRVGIVDGLRASVYWCVKRPAGCPSGHRRVYKFLLFTSL
jgi:hypothetical protein